MLNKLFVSRKEFNDVKDDLSLLKSEFDKLKNDHKATKQRNIYDNSKQAVKVNDLIDCLSRQMSNDTHITKMVSSQCSLIRHTYHEVKIKTLVQMILYRLGLEIEIKPAEDEQVHLINIK